MSKKPSERYFVSIICPTYNRRNFLPYLIHQFNYQTYPQLYMELIILDDSAISNQDLIDKYKQNNIRYIYLDKRKLLGEKRNILNSLAKEKADVIICFDDDDYYSSERVAHTVDKFKKNPKMLIAGCSKYNIYYIETDEILEYGPYSTYHGINSTFGYKKEYLNNHSYKNTDMLCEDAYFTNNFSEPMIQLEPNKVILCIAHANNAIDKEKNKHIGKKINIKINNFFKNSDKKILEWIKEFKTIKRKNKFVSVVCPTYNRRNFLPNLIHQFNYQTYPQSDMELLIIDDSKESNQDLINQYEQKNIRYIFLEERIPLGKKRNMLNSIVQKECKTDIIVCFDDDDYYSPERVEHAVKTLNNYPQIMIAGSSIIHIYYTGHKEIIEFGPYTQYHATNGTFAYKVEYLITHSYEDEKTMAEESYFTNQFREPLVQLDYKKVMLCISHNTNTVDKEKFKTTGKKCNIKLEEFFNINDNKMIEFIKVLDEERYNLALSNNNRP